MNTGIKKQAIIYNAMRADDAMNDSNPGDSIVIVVQRDNDAANSINVIVKRIGIDNVNPASNDIVSDNIAMFFSRELGDLSDDEQIYRKLKELYNDITDVVRDYYCGHEGFVLPVSNENCYTKFDEAFCVDAEEKKAYRVFWCKDMPDFMEAVTTNRDYDYWDNMSFCGEDEDDWDD